MTAAKEAARATPLPIENTVKTVNIVNAAKFILVLPMPVTNLAANTHDSTADKLVSPNCVWKPIVRFSHWVRDSIIAPKMQNQRNFSRSPPACDQN